MARIQEMTMGGRSNRFMLMLALAAGLVAAVIVFIAVNQSGSSSSSSSSAGTGIPALVASQDISAGTKITADMVKVQQVPKDLLVSGAFTDSQPAVGQAARIDIAQGEQLTNAKVGVPVPDKGLSGVVPAGMRAVGLTVSQVTAVGGILLPGDHIDIVAAYKVADAPGLATGDSLLRTQTILQNLEVLSVAQEAQQASAQAGPAASPGTETQDYISGTLPDNVKNQPAATTLTVALDPQQAQTLISFQQISVKVWAVLRAYGDTSTSDIPPVDVVESGSH